MSDIYRYILAGLVNTAVGYGIFLFAIKYTSLSPEVANALCYGVALCLAFLLNKYYVFSKKAFLSTELWRFFLAFLIAFLLNQIILIAFLKYTRISAEFVQIIAMSAYTVSFYLMNRLFVFSRGYESST